MTFPINCFICLGSTKLQQCGSESKTNCSTPPEVVIVSSDDEEEEGKRIKSWEINDVSSLGEELDVIFILRNLFDVPRKTLETYLHFSQGQSPSKWGVRLCCRCAKTVEQLKDVYKKIQNITRKYNAGKAELCKLVWRSEVKRKIQERKMGTSLEKKEGKEDNNIVEKTRRFICENDYFHLTPLFEHSPSAGDALAQRLCAEKKRSITISEHQLKSLGVVNPSVDVKLSLPNPKSVHSKYYNSLVSLSRNQVSHMFDCPLCGKTFSALIKLKFHSVALHAEKIFEEAKLNGVTDNKFLQHCFRVLTELACSPDWRPQNENSKNVECTKCGKCFADGKYLQNHWVQSHYDLLVTKLRTLQNLQLSSRNSPTTSEQFQCSRCNETFSDAEKLKQHAIIHHPEQFFPPSEFNAENIPLGSFRNACELLFRRENIKRVENDYFLCSMCSNKYNSVEPVWVHIVETHWTEMSKKLLQILKSITSVSSTTSTAAIEEPEIISITPSLPLDNEEPSPSSASLLLQSLAVGRSRRSDAKYPATLKCFDCHCLFSTSPSLSRHRNHFCPVRRSAGLLKEDKNTPPYVSAPRRFSNDRRTNIPSASGSSISALSIIKNILDAPCQPYRTVPAGAHQQISSMKYQLPSVGSNFESGIPQQIFPSSTPQTHHRVTTSMTATGQSFATNHQRAGWKPTPPPLIAIGQQYTAKQTLRKALLAQRERQHGQLTSPKRTKRSDLKHAPTMQCADCSVWFGTSSALSRHRSFFCTVRRAAGLLRDRSHPRAYTKKVNREYPLVKSILNQASPITNAIDSPGTDNGHDQNDQQQEWSFSQYFPNQPQEQGEPTAGLEESIVCNVNVDEMSLSYFDEEETIDHYQQNMGGEQVVKQEEVGAEVEDGLLAPEDDPLAM